MITIGLFSVCRNIKTSFWLTLLYYSSISSYSICLHSFDVKEGGIAIYNDTALEKILGHSDTHSRRLIRDSKVDLVENEDCRIAEQGTYMYTDIAVENS